MSSHLVVFDLDGTLIDSRRDLADSTNAVLARCGAAPLPVDEVVSFVGEGARTLVERALGRANVETPLDEALGWFHEAYTQRLTEHTRPYAGVPNALTAVHPRARLAVLTNKPAAPTVALLDAFDLSRFFESVIAGDGPWPRKPEPDGLLDIMRQADVGTAATLFVGDSMIDVETARRAGVRMCVARYGFGAVRGDLLVGPDDLAVDNPADLAGTLGRWLDG